MISAMLIIRKKKNTSILSEKPFSRGKPCPAVISRIWICPVWILQTKISGIAVSVNAASTRSDFSESQFYMCMLDEIQAMNCQFTSIKMLSTVAAGSNFSYSDFTGSDLININFNGILGDSSIFNESDLYCSRFIGASLKNTQFCGCNLVRVDFIDSNLENAVLTDSNPEDAFIMPGDVD